MSKEIAGMNISMRLLGRDNLLEDYTGPCVHMKLMNWNWCFWFLYVFSFNGKVRGLVSLLRKVEGTLLVLCFCFERVQS